MCRDTGRDGRLAFTALDGVYNSTGTTRQRGTMEASDAICNVINSFSCNGWNGIYIGTYTHTHAYHEPKRL